MAREILRMTGNDRKRRETALGSRATVAHSVSEQVKGVDSSVGVQTIDLESSVRVCQESGRKPPVAEGS